MRRSMLLFAAICLVLAGVFVQLGRWQLDRRSARQATNAAAAERARAAAIPVTAVPGDTSSRFISAYASGVPEYEREMVLVGRSRGGSPGVHLLTPVRIEGREERVLVNRGWVYSPDAASVDFDRWREGDSVSISGWVGTFADPGAEGSATLDRPRALRRIDYEAAERLAGVPLLPVVLFATGAADSAMEESPARIPLPDLNDEGPHLSYAGQWFAFATIAVVGAGIGIARARRRDPWSSEAGSNGALPPAADARRPGVSTL
jgi:surfeit locus 1 family protein